MATAATPPNGIVYFHYHESPYARRVAWYLAFRQIAYAECIQPPIMPRPDLAALGINYRRTPSMAIGRDVYLDSRAIIARLESVFALCPAPGVLHKGDGGPGGAAGQVHDRCIVVRQRDDDHAAGSADFPEQGFLAGSGGILWEGVWAVDWIVSGLSPPKEHFSEQVYPKTYDWLSRFKKEVEAAQARAPKPVTLAGPEAVKAVLDAEYSDKDLIVDPSDPVGVEAGTNVELYPIDSGGFTHKDKGRLVKLTRDDVAIAVQSSKAEREVHVHAPRWNFKVEQTGDARL